MSQIFIPAASSSPKIPTSFVTDSGTAVAAANILNVPGATSTNNNLNGITTRGSGNTLDVVLTNRITGTATTTDGTTVTNLYSFDMGATPATYLFYVRVVAFDTTDSLSAAYASYRCVRTDGANGTLIGADTNFEIEEGAMSGVTISNTISGNNSIVTVQGLAGKTIHYVAVTEYQKVT